VLKNGVGRYNIFFFLFTQSDSVCACAKLFVDEESTWHKSNRGIEQKHSRCFYAKTTQKGGFSKHIAWVSIGFFTGFKTIKQRPISFVLGYLRMAL
jgi:hypothetical protein